jgi:hypothetical protein
MSIDDWICELATGGGSGEHLAAVIGGVGDAADAPVLAGGSGAGVLVSNRLDCARVARVSWSWGSGRGRGAGWRIPAHGLGIDLGMVCASGTPVGSTRAEHELGGVGFGDRSAGSRSSAGAIWFASLAGATDWAGVTDLAGATSSTRSPSSTRFPSSTGEAGAGGGGRRG